MNRGSPLSVDNILRFLELRGNPASLSELQHGLKLRKSEQRPLLNMLGKLKKRKAIVELTDGRLVLSSRRQERQTQKDNDSRPSPTSSATSHGRNSLSGRLILHQDGYGFVVPDKPMPQLDRDVFIPRDAVGDAMHGDHVLINLGRISPGPAGQRAEGRIVRVLDRAHPTVVGLFRYGPRGNFVLPYDTRIQHQVEIPPGDELTTSLREKFTVGDSMEAGRMRRVGRIEELDGAVVNVELLRFQKGAKIFASFRSSPSTERPRAISTTPCMWNGEPMAGGTCKCTSPTLRTTFEPRLRSTTKHGFAAPLSILSIAQFRCCRNRFRTAFAR